MEIWCEPVELAKSTQNNYSCINLKLEKCELQVILGFRFCCQNWWKRSLVFSSRSAKCKGARTSISSQETYTFFGSTKTRSDSHLFNFLTGFKLPFSLKKKVSLCQKNWLEIDCKAQKFFEVTQFQWRFSKIFHHKKVSFWEIRGTF